MELKKLTQKNIITLGSRGSLPGPGGLVSITVAQGGIQVRPYEEGDEENDRITMKCFDARGRVVLPKTVLEQTQIDGVVEASVQEDGSVLLLPSAKCRDCPYRTS